MAELSEDTPLSSDPTLSAGLERPSGVAASLDDIPVEILMDVVSFLDYWSMLSLERVSKQCWDAVSLHLARVSVFDVSEDGDNCLITGPDSVRDMVLWSSVRKASLLPRLTGLRQLRVTVEPGRDGQWLLKALLAASPSWPRLEKLALYLRCKNIDPALLGQLCSNCTRLTDVTLKSSHQILEAVLTARRGQLRSLELLEMRYRFPDRVAAGLASCVQLERLLLDNASPVLDFLPPDGLPTLRHFSLSNSSLTDAVLAWLLQRQPGLESLTLRSCDRVDERHPFTGILTPEGLELLGQLPALRSLIIEGIEYECDGISDVFLGQLSKAPLTELQLGAYDRWGSITAAGLCRLSRHCPALRWATVWDGEYPEETIQTIDCRTSAAQRELHRVLERLVMVECRNELVYCRLGEAPLLHVRENMAWY